MKWKLANATVVTALASKHSGVKRNAGVTERTAVGAQSTREGARRVTYR